MLDVISQVCINLFLFLVSQFNFVFVHQKKFKDDVSPRRMHQYDKSFLFKPKKLTFYCPHIFHKELVSSFSTKITTAAWHTRLTVSSQAGSLPVPFLYQEAAFHRLRNHT